MEKVPCEDHGSLCMLKTGVRDGPSRGKSFYVCVEKDGCSFSLPASIPPSHCLQHRDAMVELQALSYDQQREKHRLFYRCIVGKKAGQRWCGNVPWAEPPTEAPPTCPPPARNPFKAPRRLESDSEWRRIQGGGGHVTGNGDVDEDGGVRASAKGHEEASSSYRGTQLPAGMKVKKRVSHEEKKAEEQAPGGELSPAPSGKPSPAPSGDSSPAPSGDSSPTPSGDSSPTPSGDPSPAPSGDPSPAPSGDPSPAPPGPERRSSGESGSEDDVVLVSVKPAAQKMPPAAAVQKTLSAFPGFQPAAAAEVKGHATKGLHGLLSSQLQQKKATLAAVNVAALPDGGARLRTQVKQLEDALEALSLEAPPPSAEPMGSKVTASDQVKPPAPPSAAILLPAPPPLHAATWTQGAGDGPTFYGGRMTDARLLAVKDATCRAIDHLHGSLESRPGPEAEEPDPAGIRVTLLAHQRRALAWLLWRETQSPCGGVFADDMGLGKTLTIIALVLAKKAEEAEVEGKKKGWISRADPGQVVPGGTLVICPASLVHHWKKEIERHVRVGGLTVYLYHGPDRKKCADTLARYDVVVTTYSLVSKEIPVQKADADDSAAAPPGSAPLLRVSWARVVLDEAHNIKNPKVQTSVAVCRLRAVARWAVTGTPIQNNLLDMYSLLKFLRCSPFDEFKLWKAQVDNGSKRGRERLNILTRALLLRRTKDQLDATGKPLVSLPNRTCRVHQVKLTQDEQAVYDVVFAQSRSTLQSYLKRHEDKDLGRGGPTGSNPFNTVAQEFGIPQAEASPQQASSTVHILSLLLRLRQCCCHLSLLKKTLDSSELQGDGIVLSLEEQLNALSLSSSPSSSSSDPELKDTVGLNGTRFAARLFEEDNESTKISAIMSELKEIRRSGDGQKSVVVSQWTSMLRIVGVHLAGAGLRYAVIDGTVSPKRRMDLVEEFNTNPRGAQVMLVSLCAGGVGLNLVGGNHLFLIDMHWNPALEDQACDRIYRVGQTRDVTIHRFVCEDTVEQKISTLQLRKKELAQNVLSGTGSTFSKLSLADLRIIFGV